MGAVLVAGVFRATKQEAIVTESKERVWFVETLPVVVEDIRPSIRLFGEIVAGREAKLRSLSAGTVLSVGKNFIDGGSIQEGEKLLSIDPFVFLRRLSEEESLLIEAEARYQELLIAVQSEMLLLDEVRLQMGIHESDLVRYEQLEVGVVSEQKVDEKRIILSQARESFLLRQQRVAVLNAQLDQQQAVIDRYRASKERAERELQKAEMRAPFDGYLTDINAAVGMRLSVGDPVARLIDSGGLEAKVFLSNAQFGRIFEGPALFLPITIEWRMGEARFNFSGNIERMESQVDASLGGVHVFARLDKRSAESPIRPGAVVEVVANDRLYEQVARLPEDALHNERIVYVLSEGRLKKRNVTLVGRDQGYVLLHGELEEGDLVVITRFDGIGEGIAARGSK